MILALVACGDDDGPMLDAGADADMDSSDVCADGRPLCATAGNTCSGDDLVMCAMDADGCLVQTTTDCTATGQECESGMCVDVVDPCEGVPMDEQCDTEGRTCDGDTLVDCAPNATGCLVVMETDCAATDGGVCVEGDPTMCVLPADPCEGVSDCDTEGTSCDGDNLVTCAPNAFGCLVETTDDCTSRAGGTCDSGTNACVFTGDPCAGITECAAEGVACAGPELVECAPDAFGCLVETRTDCSDTMFGFCDTDADPNSCSTAAVDPCAGVTECDPVGRACSDDDLVVCALDAFGCAVETTTDCTADGNVCGDRDGMAICDDVCSFRDVCPSAMFCEGADAVTCADDADGCLVETARETCGGSTSCDTGSCVDLCPEAVVTTLNCASGTVSGDTAAGTAVIDNFACTSFSYPNNEQIHTFVSPDAQEVQIVATRLTGTRDYDLYALRADGAACTDDPECADRSTGVTATETVNFNAAPGELFYIVYDLFGSTVETTDYTLEVTCTAIVCGDSTINGDETCDDGNATAGDGCSDTCTVEDGYECTGTGPGSCALTCGDSTINGDDECDDGNTTAGDGCSDTCTVEPGYECTGTGPGSCVFTCGNSMLDGSDECDDGDTDDADGCSSVCAIEDGFWCTGLPTVCAAPTCGDATVDAGESCEDGNTVDGDGCSARCATEIAASGSAVMLTGSIETTDPTYNRQSGSCFSATGNDTYYDAFVVENNTGSAQTLTITASWMGDGYLFAYDYSFYDANPQLNCVDGDDDFGGTSGSQMTGVPIAAGERLVIIATTFSDTTAIGDYTIDVTTD